MTEPISIESIRELKALAEELGVSDRQLRRWRAEGLLPKPIRRQGKGRAVGSEAFYPAGTCEQLRAAARWFKRYPRSVELVRWALWCDGFPVREDFHRGLVKRLREAQTFAVDALDAFDREDQDNPIDALGEFDRAQTRLVPLVTEVLKTIAGQGPPLPIAAGEIATPIRKPLIRMFGEPLRSYLKNVGESELTQFIAGVVPNAFHIFDYAGLERALVDNPQLLTEGRDEAVECFRRWAPERAAREPPPPKFVYMLVVWQIAGIELADFIDHALADPEGRETAEKLLKELLSS